MIVDRRTIGLAFAFACLPMILLCPKASQAATNINPASIVATDSETINDIFIGTGARGPYALNWRNIETRSESVLVSGNKLQRDVDYTIDYTSGTIAFSNPIPNEAITRVTYRCILGKASPSNGVVGIPLNLRLLDGNRTRLDVLGQLRTGSPTNPQSAMNTFGINSGIKLSNTTAFSTSLFVNPEDTDLSGRRIGVSDRSGMKLGANTLLGGLSITGSYVRSGEQFTQAKGYGLQQAKQFVDLGAIYGKITDPVFASFSYKQQEDLGGAKKGASRTTSEEKVVLNFEGAPKITASHITSEDTNPDDTGIRTSVDTLQLDKTFDQKTTATAIVRRTTTDANGDQERVTTSGLTVQSSAIDKVQMRGAIHTRDSDISGNEVGLDLGFRAAVNKRMSIDSGYSQMNSDAKGMSSTTALGLAAKPRDWMDLTTRVTWQDSEMAGEQTGIDVGLKAAPNKRLRIDASHRMVDAELTGQESNTLVKVVTTPVDRVDLSADVSVRDTASGSHTSEAFRVVTRPIDQLRVEGVYSDSLTECGEDLIRRSVRVEAQPADFVKVVAGAGDTLVGSELSTTREATIELAASDSAKAVSSFRQIVNGRSTTTIKDYSGTLAPSRYLEVSGEYRDRETTALNDINSKSFQMAVGPKQTFRVTGHYSLNPEDKDGNINRCESTAVGLQMKLGVLGISSAYAQKEDYMIGQTSMERQLGLSLPMFGHGRFDTSVKNAQAVAGAMNSTTTYTIGYTHIVGSRFDLSLAGELTRYQEDLAMPQQEYKATAKLGIRF